MASSRVAGRRSAMTTSTGRARRYEIPKLPWTALPTKRANCTTKGSLSPSCSRSSSRCCSVVSWPTMLLIGSPTKLKRLKDTSATTSITMMDCSSRRTRKASITGILRRGSPPRAGRGGTRPSSSSHRRSLEGHVGKARRVVGANGHVDVGPHRPVQDLVVQRNVGQIIQGDFPGLGDQAVAQVEVGFAAHGQHQLVHALVAEAGHVPGSARTVVRVIEVVEDVLAIEGRHAPAQHVEIQLAILQLLEVQRADR